MKTTMTGMENFRDDGMQGITSMLPTWRVAHTAEKVTTNPRWGEGALIKIEDGKVTQWVDSLEIVIVTSVVSRLKKDSANNTVCYSEEGKIPINKYINVFSSECASCKWCFTAKNDKDEVLPNQCKNLYKYLFYQVATPDNLEQMILTHGNYASCKGLKHRLFAGMLHPDQGDTMAIFGFKLKVTTEIIGDNYKYPAAKFDCIGINDDARILEIDQYLKGKKNPLLMGGSSDIPQLSAVSAVQEDAPETEPAVQTMDQIIKDVVKTEPAPAKQDEIPF